MPRLTVLDKTGLPKNLRILVGSNESHERFRLHYVYVLELRHKGTNCFAAALKENNVPIITTDPRALSKVAEVLPPRRFRMTQSTAYINFQLTVAYIIYGTSNIDLENSEPRELFVPDGITELLKGEDKEPFIWNPGLAGEEISRDEFRREIETVAKHYVAK